MNAHHDPLAAAEHNAHVWLAAVAEGLGTEDRQHAYRTLRAWLHAVRDLLPLSGAVHLGAQLPELVRGVYFEDWTPNRRSERCTAAEFVADFARVAHVPLDEAVAEMGAVTSVLAERFSPGQLEHALIQLPRQLRSVLHGEPLRHEATAVR